MLFLQVEQVLNFMRKLFNKKSLIALAVASLIVVAGFAIVHAFTLGDNVIRAQNKTGLVGQWTLRSADYNDPVVQGQYGSDDLTAVSSPTLATGHDGRANTALTFDGSADYLKQKVHDTNQGTMYASIVAANSFFIDDGQDFSDYEGASGDTPYMIVAKDSGDDVGWGYIGEMGSGETLGAELITNEDMELDSNWTDISGSEPVTNERSDVDKHGDTYSRHVVGDANNEGIKSDTFSVTAGELYKFTFWIKNISGSSKVFWYDGNGVNIDYEASINEASWAEKTFYFTANHTGSSARVEFQCQTTGYEFYVDDVSVKEVTDPATTTGVKIYSTKDGSTQSFAGTTDFDANDISSYEIRKTDFQITGALTVGAWVKSSVMNKKIVTKYDYGATQRSYSLGLSGSGYAEYTISLDGDNTNVATAAGSTDLADDNWHFIIGEYTPSVHAKVYVDGVLIDTDSSSVPASIHDSYTKYAVAAQYNSGAVVSHFNGSIQSPFIYNRALSATEILNLYNSQKRQFIDVTSGGKHYVR